MPDENNKKMFQKVESKPDKNDDIYIEVQSLSQCLNVTSMRLIGIGNIMNDEEIADLKNNVDELKEKIKKVYSTLQQKFYNADFDTRFNMSLNALKDPMQIPYSLGCWLY